MIKTENLQVLG